jgi:carbamoyltransferase
MTAVLGISAFYHDSAAALVVDGELVAAAQEERFTRVKHDSRFPAHAVRYCLAEAGITPGQLDFVGFYDKPLLKFDRLLDTYLSYAPSGFRSFLAAMPVWLRQKLYLDREMRTGIGSEYTKPIIFAEHHESHAASAFFPSPYREAAILTMDGVGEWTTSAFGIGRENRIDLLSEQRFPHSLGLLYSAFTYFTGFTVNSGEYKLMGLAPYGEPRYVESIREHLIDLKDDGSFRLDLSYFNYCQGLTMTSAKFEQLFGGPRRQPESRITQREMDLAASIQVVTEEIMLRCARHVYRETGLDRLCLAGGVALNCVANGRIHREGPFRDIWIQPAAGDAGGALGVAMFIEHQLLRGCRGPLSSDSQCGSFLGPRASEADIQSFLDQVAAPYQRYDDEAELCDDVAGLIEEGNVVGWFQGRMEFGPRALGHRSILGDPRNSEMQSVMNLKIKFRESFRPFAPSVLAERAHDYFEMREGQESPYMLHVAPIDALHRMPGGLEHDELQGMDRLRAVRSSIPAVTHVDYSARVQTVDEARNGRYYTLLKAFERRTGCPVLINTSFNVRGEPIVATPEDAYRCFMATGIDALVLESFVLLKNRQRLPSKQERDAYMAGFALD